LREKREVEGRGRGAKEYKEEKRRRKMK